jgi:hypothetical protein
MFTYIHKNYMCPSSVKNSAHIKYGVFVKSYIILLSVMTPSACILFNVDTFVCVCVCVCVCVFVNYCMRVDLTIRIGRMK